jgi:hypothetical protein
MQDPLQTTDSENIVADIYDGYNDTQREILAIEIRKTRNKLFTIAAVLLVFNLLAVMISGVPLSYVIGDILLFPVIFVGLGFLATKEPLVAIALGFLIMIGFWLYIAFALDISFLLKGWLGKAIIIYLLFAGLQNAREAHRIRQELKTI